MNAEPNGLRPKKRAGITGASYAPARPRRAPRACPRAPRSVLGGGARGLRLGVEAGGRGRVGVGRGNPLRSCATNTTPSSLPWASAAPALLPAGTPSRAERRRRAAGWAPTRRRRRRWRRAGGEHTKGSVGGDRHVHTYLVPSWYDFSSLGATAHWKIQLSMHSMTVATAPLRILSYNVRYFGHATRGLATRRRPWSGSPRPWRRSIRSPRSSACRRSRRDRCGRPWPRRASQGRRADAARAVRAELSAALTAAGKPDAYEALLLPGARLPPSTRTHVYTTGLAVLAHDAFVVDRHNAEQPARHHPSRAPVKGFKQTRICAHVRFRPIVPGRGARATWRPSTCSTRT